MKINAISLLVIVTGCGGSTHRPKVTPAPAVTEHAHAAQADERPAQSPTEGADVCPSSAPLVESGPSPIHKESFAYPKAAIRAGVEGMMTFSLCVDDGGRVVGVELAKDDLSRPARGRGEPRRQLASAAQQAIAKWRYPSGDGLYRRIVKVHALIRPSATRSSLSSPRRAGNMTWDVRRTGACGRKEVEDVLKARWRGLQSCYRRELNKNRDLEGNVTFGWTFDGSGVVVRTTIWGSTLLNFPVERCMKREAERWRLSKPPPKGCRVRAVFEFSPQN